MANEAGEQPVLIVAPTGRDSEVLRLVLVREGIPAAVCGSLAATVEALDGAGAGALVLAEEALSREAAQLTDWMARQPAWSDLPIILLRSDLAQFQGNAAAAAGAFERLGNVALLERPLRAETLISAVRSALRARRRQYQVRDHLVEREAAAARLRELNATLEDRVARAVAERHEAEAALAQAQKMEALGRLTGGVAHDFNNLLTAIVGNLELLQIRFNPDDRAGRKLIEAAIRSGHRAARLTQQLLAFGRKQTLQPRSVDVNRVIAGMIEMLGRTIGPASSVATSFARNLWPARVDEDQLVLVVLNLAINARDAMPTGGVVRLETANVPDNAADRPDDLGEGEFVRVAVVDNGTGIGDDVLGQVFEPFFTTKDHGKGTGLGLSQVYGLTKQSGGTVEIKTRVGEGTAVRVYLPRAERVERSRERGEEQAPGSGEGGFDGHILVVDDDHDVRRVTAEYLDGVGFTVTEAASGSAALALLRADPGIDLLVADFAMPGMDGIELMRQAQEERPGLPALLVTAYARDGLTLDEFPVEVLRKPYRLAELGARVRALLPAGAAPYAPRPAQAADG